MREWRYNYTNLDLSTRWRCVVSFIPKPFYPLGKEIPESIGYKVE
jgi:hypothetical protein